MLSLQIKNYLLSELSIKKLLLNVISVSAAAAYDRYRG